MTKPRATTKKPHRHPPAAGVGARQKSGAVKRINLALQGGGAHGAFAWGILDCLLEDERLEFEGISGTSAGSMNAVVLAYGLHKNGRVGAREALANFWRAISEVGERFSPLKTFPWEAQFQQWNRDQSWSFQMFKAMTSALSPYQFNPFNFNPLRDILQEQIDFDDLKTCKRTKLFLSATNVQSGNVRIFNTNEITADAVLASACLPFLHHAVEIEGQSYWDGGYMGNPALFPLFYGTDTRDVLIVHINPITREGTPKAPHEIDDRVNEISFNSSLIKELRAVAFVQKMLDEGWLKDEYRDQMKYVLIHSLRADKVLADLSSASKLNTDWEFLTMLRDRGRVAAAEWLAAHFDDIGVRQTVDLRAEFLNSGSEMKTTVHPTNRKPISKSGRASKPRKPA